MSRLTPELLFSGQRPPEIYPLEYPYPTIPEYREGSFGQWLITHHSPKRIKGYFSGPHVPRYPSYVLHRRSFGSKRRTKTWMSLTPMELESHAMQIASAHGVVGVGGLGMGMYLWNILSKPEVTKVYVFENDNRIVRLLDGTTSWRQWEGADKVKLILGDIRTAQSPEPLDYLYVDIWPLLGDHKIEEDMQRIIVNMKPAEVSWWGMEMSFLDWTRVKKISFRSIRQDHIWQWREDTKMPINVGDPDAFIRSLDAMAANLMTGGFV